MTVPIKDGWAQWDYQVGTFRAEVSGVIYGDFEGEIATPEALAQKVKLTAGQITLLRAEKAQFDADPNQ